VSIYKRGDEEISYLVGIVSLVNYGAFPLVAVIVKVIRNYPTKKMRCDNKLVISSEKAAITYANLMWRFNIWIFHERKENEKNQNAGHLEILIEEILEAWVPRGR